jgi:hypothetical protein
MSRVKREGVTKMSDENKAPESDVQAFGTPITVGGDGGPAAALATGTPITVGGDGGPSAAIATGTPITVGGDGSPQQ